MKKLFFVLLIVFPSVLFSQTARIKIDTDRQIGQIDPMIYGVFMEPIRNSLDAIYKPGSPLADENGVMKSYIEAAKELKITQMRWPGGNYLSGYNWKDGIGPLDQRPVRKELAWGVLDKNQVGTDEWIKIAKSLGVENVMCINLGTGTLDGKWRQSQLPSTLTPPPRLARVPPRRSGSGFPKNCRSSCSADCR